MELTATVYEELRQVARRHMRHERPDHTLGTTGLAHEAYLRLGGMTFASPAAFWQAAGVAMRRILVDHARARLSDKRGGARVRLNWDQASEALQLAQNERFEEILALDEALSRLEEQDRGAAAVVRLRFFAGLSVDETAEALGISARTVKREWRFARAMLYRLLQGDQGDQR